MHRRIRATEAAQKFMTIRHLGKMDRKKLLRDQTRENKDPKDIRQHMASKN